MYLAIGYHCWTHDANMHIRQTLRLKTKSESHFFELSSSFTVNCTSTNISHGPSATPFHVSQNLASHLHALMDSFSGTASRRRDSALQLPSINGGDTEDDSGE
jgi:hypothetical protein